MHCYQHSCKHSPCFIYISHLELRICVFLFKRNAEFYCVLQKSAKIPVHIYKITNDPLFSYFREASTVKRDLNVFPFLSWYSSLHLLDQHPHAFIHAFRLYSSYAASISVCIVKT